MALITIGVINKESDGRAVISVTFQGRTVHSIDQPIGGEREECPYHTNVILEIFEWLSHSRRFASISSGAVMFGT